MVKRTTLVMDEELLLRVKRAALDSHKTLREIVEEALRRYVKTTSSQQVDLPQAHALHIRGVVDRRSIYESQ